MNGKTFTRKMKVILPLLLLIFAVNLSWGVNIIQYPLATNATSLPLGGTLSISPSLVSDGWFGGSGASAHGWNNADQYWEITPVSTVGLHTITVSASMFSDVTGPANFKIQYKINGGSWNDGGTISLTSTTGTKSVVLPSACANKASVAVRWITTDTKDTNGNTVSASAKSYTKTIKITGNTPTTPDSQSNYISFVSITPTTITIDALPGNGSHRIVVINTENVFVDPVDDQEYVANTSYNTVFPATGQQVIYNGTGTEVTVTVPSSNNVYWVRYYDYDYNDGMTRYLTPEDVDNPNKCELERITLNSPVYHLVRANLGATIQPTKKSTIYDRGIYWSTTPNVSVSNGTKLSDAVDADGLFSFNTIVNRGSTIYFKAYVKNVSGTIWTTESSFDNRPVFLGTGNWEDANLWNVTEVPGANGDATYGNILDSPTISGICTLTASNSVTNLTINNTRKLSINAQTTLTIAGTLANNATTSGLVIGAGNGTTANASLIFSNKALNQNVPASVQMYSKASTSGGNHWQYFGVPVQGQTVGTTFGGSERVRRFNEANFDPTGNDYGLWYPYPVSTMAGSETLSPVVGYEVVQASAKTYTFKGNLNATDFNHPLAYTTVPQLADYAGQNIIANPYTAAINISGLDFGSAEATAYLYNTGSRDEWTNNDGEATAGVNPGTYIAVPSALAGSLGIPSQIPSMQGFLVKTTTPTSISIPYSSVVTNAAPQRAPALDQKVATMIDVIGSKSSDRMWIFSLPTCTRNYDNGFDGRKILGYNTQLFAMEGSEDYQINAVNDINNTYLGFQSGSETNLKLKFTHQNLEDKYYRVYLTDLVENKTIDITASGTEYVFTAAASTTPSQRFKITTSNTITTDNVTPNAGEQIKIFGSQGNAVVQNLSNAQGNAFIYTMGGQFVRNVPFGANGVAIISNLKAGAYIVKAKTAENEVNSCLIIR